MSTRTPKAAAPEPADNADPIEDSEERECSRCGDTVATLSSDDLCDGCVAEESASAGPGDDLGDDSLAEMAREYLPAADASLIEVHHGEPPAADPETDVDDQPLDMPNMRFGQSVFAELARESAGLYGDWPDLPAMPTGIALGFDEARAENLDGFVNDKTTLANWMRAARANTYGSGIAA